MANRSLLRWVAPAIAAAAFLGATAAQQLSPLAINPQPLPPNESINPQPLPPHLALNPQPLPPRMGARVNPQPLPPGES
jgi:hypothetical protein